MSQIPLSLTTQLPYSSGNFVNHSGVKDVRAECVNHLSSNSFRLCFVQGKARSGKTHLSIQLAEDVLARGVFPRLVEGMDDFFRVVPVVRQGEVCLIDGADSYLQMLLPGNSGSFVHAIETLRARGVPVVFFSGVGVSNFGCDEHVTSRLLAGAGLVLESPASEDMAHLIGALCRQRGLELRNSHIEFLEKRLQRDIAALERYIERVVHLSRVLNRPLNFAVLGDACEAEYDLKEIPS